jgi:hypothetical protein
MIRIAAIFCFSATLFCPVFCLAGEDGDCAAHGEETSQNCEAMSVGAVIAELETAIPPTIHLSAAFDLFCLVQPRLAVSRGWLHLAARNRSNTKPPPAAIRQARLQTFLF